MAIRKSAYNTSATSSMVISGIRDKLEAIDLESFSQQPASVFSVMGQGSYERSISGFAFPILSEKSPEGHAYIDLRSYGSYDELQNVFRTRDGAGVEYMQLHGALTVAWHRGRQRSLQLVSHFPLQVFMSWISESLGKKMHLDGATQYKVQILAGLFYLSNFTDNKAEADDKLSMVNLFTRELKLGDYQTNKELVDKYSDIADVHDFCKVCYEATSSLSLKNLNASILYSVVGGAMWGANAQERLCVSLEYPPTWIASLYQVMTDQSYRGKCILNNIGQRSYLKKGAVQFIENCLSSIDQSN